MFPTRGNLLRKSVDLDTDRTRGYSRSHNPMGNFISGLSQTAEQALRGQKLNGETTESTFHESIEICCDHGRSDGSNSHQTPHSLRLRRLGSRHALESPILDLMQPSYAMSHHLSKIAFAHRKH